MLTVMARLSTLLEIDLDPYEQKLQYSGYFSMVLCFHFLLHQNYSNRHQYHLHHLCYQCFHYPVQILQFLVCSSVLPLHYFPFENYSHHHHCHPHYLNPYCLHSTLHSFKFSDFVFLFTIPFILTVLVLVLFRIFLDTILCWCFVLKDLIIDCFHISLPCWWWSINYINLMSNKHDLIILYSSLETSSLPSLSSSSGYLWSFSQKTESSGFLWSFIQKLSAFFRTSSWANPLRQKCLG